MTMEGVAASPSVSGRLGKRTEIIVLLSILGSGMILRILGVTFIASPLESDYLGYWTIARNLYAGQGLTGADGQPTAILNVGYPLFLLAVFKVLGPSVAAVKIANVALGISSIALLYFTARRMFGVWQAAALGSLLLAVYFEAIVYTAYVAKENLMVFLVMLQLFLVASRGRWRDGSAVLFGCATGGMALVGNAGLVLLPALLLQLAFSIGRLGAILRYVGIGALFTALTITPILLHNNRVFGAYVLNNNGGFNLYIGNNPNASPYFQSIIETPIGPQWPKMLATLGEHGVDTALRDLALAHIAQYPAETLRLALRKAAAFWSPPTHAGKYREAAATRLARLGWLIEFYVICALFLVSYARWRTDGRTLLVLTLMVLA